MTNVDESLFLSASNNVTSAKTLINECINLIDNYQVTDSSGYESAKKNIKESGIDNLINKIAEERNWLINYDQDFARNYLSLLVENSRLDPSVLQNMSPEEQAEYIIKYDACQREFNDVCIAMLEKNEKNGMLTEEMKLELTMRKKIAEQYDLKDDMLKYDMDSDKYIELYEKYSKYDREIISINPNLTEEQKSEFLKQYDVNYEKTMSELDYKRDITNLINELKKLEPESEEYYRKSAEINQRNIDYYNYIGVENLTEEQLKIYEQQKDYKELNYLYIDGDKTLIRQKKIDMGIATEAEIEYENANWWGRFEMNANTVTATVITSLGGIGEGLIDGGLMLTCGTVGLFNDDVAKWTEDAVSVNWSDAAYDGLVVTGGLNSYSAYSGYHTVTDAITTTGGYIALSLIPGLGGSAVMALAGGGATAQRAFDSGASFNEVWAATATSTALAFFADVGLDKLNASGASLLTKTGVRTAIGVGEPALNAIVEYVTFGNDGDLSLEGLHEYAKESDAYTNMAIGGTVANAAGLISDYSKARSTAKTAEYKTNFNGNMDEMTDVQRAQAWSDYYSQQYGDAFEGKFSNEGGIFSRKIQTNGNLVTTNLTDSELISFANDFYNLSPPIDNIKDLPNFGVIEDYNSIKINDGKLGVNWVDDNGALSGTRKSTTIKAGVEIDRFGNPNGCFVGKMSVDINGNFVGIDYDMRSLPYAEGSQAYTRMKVLKDINSETVSEAINNLDPQSDLYKRITKQMKWDGLPYSIDSSGKINIEINEAVIAPAYGHSGGGIQYELPIRTGFLKELGFIDY